MRAGLLLRRAGLAASGLELLLKLCSASKEYGFVLQPTGARQRCSRICTYQITGRVARLRVWSS